MDISDPAWFYSSLAQVSAAIVGLIGAVLGTRLVSHIPDMRAALVSIHSRMSNVLDMLAARSTSYPRDFARVIDEAFLPRIRIAYQPFAGLLSEETLRERVRILRRMAGDIQGQSAEALRARNQLNHDANVIDALADEIEFLRTRLVPRPFQVTLGILGFLAITGILWPLGALPGSTRPLFPKAWMILALAFALAGLTGYFLYELIALNRLGRIDWSVAVRKK